jgi:hypothetical protein
MLTVFRPSSEVVREGRILKGNQTFIRPIVGVFMVDDSWAHTQAAKNGCLFSLLPGIEAPATVWWQDFTNSDLLKYTLHIFA